MSKVKQEDMKFWSPVQATIDTDIKGLMGMKLRYISGRGKEQIGIVVGVDPYIGCSIVDEDDHKVVLQCLHGPFDPSRREIYLRNDSWKSEYYHDFKAFVALLHKAKETGEFSNREYCSLLAEAYGEADFGSGPCPFGV
jgi:hypothetical protein